MISSSNLQECVLGQYKVFYLITVAFGYFVAKLGHFDCFNAYFVYKNLVHRIT